MRRALHDWLLGIWYGDRAGAGWLRPLAAVFGLATRSRRLLYRRGWLATFRSSRPVVVVGNLSVGGTGKTPLVAWLARRLAARGLAVGVALRGYGGAGGPARRVAADDDPAQAGDEAVMLARRLAVPVAVGPRRAEAVRLLERRCDLVLCDDGLQHYGLARDFEIAVVDGTRGLGNGRLLPAGPLREPARRLDEVDAVVVNGRGFSRAGAVTMALDPVAIVAVAGGERRQLASFSGRRVRAVAAIGHPERFFALLRQHGLSVDAVALPDHASFAPGIARGGEGLPVLMTEKDAVKCRGAGWDDCWWLEVEARLEEPAASRIVDRIAALAAAGKAPS